MEGLNRFYYPTKYKSRAEAIAFGVKCVFMSYQKNDRASALKVAEYLQGAGIDVYIDVYDTELKIQNQNSNPKEVTRAICNGINNSSHMLVLISPDTMTSTWVPFEIGYGYDKTDLGILCLKGIARGKLPDYVKTATIVRDIYDLNNLIERLSGLKKEVLLERRIMSDYSSYSNPLINVMDNLVNDI